MPSTDTDTAKPRDLRDSPYVRIAILVAVLAVAFLYVRGCVAQSRAVSSEQAVEIARAEVSFTPDRYQVRFLQRGIPARGFWGVSFIRVGPDGVPTKVEVYLVDAKTGDVTPA
jgi:hypothetical protein